jgi:hypothetical protein
MTNNVISLRALFSFSIRKLHIVFPPDLDKAYLKFIFVHKIPDIIVSVLNKMFFNDEESSNVHARERVYKFIRAAAIRIKEDPLVLKALQELPQTIDLWKQTFPAIQSPPKGGDMDISAQLRDSVALNRRYTAPVAGKKGKQYPAFLVDDLMLFSFIFMHHKDGLFFSRSQSSQELLLTFRLCRKLKDFPSGILQHIIRKRSLKSTPSLVESTFSLHSSILESVVTNDTIFSLVTSLCEAGFTDTIFKTIITLYGIVVIVPPKIGTNSKCLCSEFIRLKQTVDQHLPDGQNFKSVSPLQKNRIIFTHYKPLVPWNEEFEECKNRFNAFQYAFESLPLELHDTILSNLRYRHDIPDVIVGEDYPFSCFAPTTPAAGFYPLTETLPRYRNSEDVFKTLVCRDDFIFQGLLPLRHENVHKKEEHHRAVSSISLTDFHTVADQNTDIVTIGRQHPFLIDELSLIFENYKLAIVPKHDTPGKIIMLSSRAVDTLEKIATDKPFLAQSIGIVKKHREDTLIHISTFLGLLQQSSTENKLHIHTMLIAILRLGMNIRGWTGEVNTPYPLTSIQIDDSAVQLRTSNSLIEVNSLIDGIPDIKLKIAFYRLPQFSHHFFPNEYGSLFLPSLTSEQGVSLTDRIELLNQGERLNNVNSCIRTGSNYLLASVYFYLVVFFNDPPPFDIQNMTEIF